MKKIDRSTALVFATACVLLVMHAVTLSADLHTITKDFTDFYGLWYQKILAGDRLGSIGGWVANYTPPTIYLFSVASIFNGLLAPEILLKLINVPFLLVAGWLSYGISVRLGAHRQRALAIALLVMVSPEIWQNSFRWGQYDLIHTTFLFGFFYCLLLKKPIWAMVFWGSAFAFKLQTVFAAPVLLGLVLSGELSVPMIAIVPVVYVCWMLPARMVGRHWKDLLTVYARQYDTYPQLSKDAPNLYYLIQNYLTEGMLAAAMKIAILLAGIAAVWAAWRYSRRTGGWEKPEAILLFLTLSQILVPYLLPRMHERYFFSGNAFALLLLARRPGLWFLVVLLQGSAYLTYRIYFLTFIEFPPRRLEFLPPILMLTAALVWLIVLFLHANTRVEDRAAVAE